MKVYEIIKTPSQFIDSITGFKPLTYIIVFALVFIFTKISYWFIDGDLVAKNKWGKLWIFLFCFSLGTSWMEIFTDILMVLIGGRP